MAEISPLRRRMIEDMTVRNLSPATQQSPVVEESVGSGGTHTTATEHIMAFKWTRRRAQSSRTWDCQNPACTVAQSADSA